VVKDGKIEARDVKLGDRFENDVEILEGLEPGETIATTQLSRLDTGTRVVIATGEEKGRPGRQERKAD
jgi:hypothetical protein